MYVVKQYMDYRGQSIVKLRKSIRICGDEHMGVRLGNICRFQSGGTPSKGKPEFFNGTIPWITTTALNGGNIGKESAVDWISEQAIKESAAKIVPAFSIMVGTRVGVGKVAINTTSMSTSQDIVSLLDIDENVWSKAFLCKFLQAKGTFLNSQARGATIKGIKIDVLSELELPEIPMEEQQHISQIIDKIKAIIVIRQQQLQKLDDLVKARFVELFGPCQSMASMDELCSIITDGTHQPPKFHSDGIPFIFVSNLVKNTVTYNAEKFISEETYSELYKRTPIEVGDLLLSTVGSYGHPAVVVEDRKFLFQRHIAYLKPKRDIVNSFYLHAALLSPDSQRQIEEKVKGIAQKTLNLSEIKKILIPLPSIEEQNAFEVFVKQTDKSKAVIQKALDEAQLLFDSLMQKYFG